jgi:predicted transcriptional regulator
MYADIVIIASKNKREVMVGELAILYPSVSKSKIQRALRNLVLAGWIRRVKRGYYYPVVMDVVDALFNIEEMS